MDPLGNIPIFITVLKNVVSESRMRKILIRELAIALLVLLVFLFIGLYFLQLLNLNQEAVHIWWYGAVFNCSAYDFPYRKGNYR